jgi:glycosyltransferase involved in cell wall biosynthesis
MRQDQKDDYNVAYFAFDQFIPSDHAGFVHTCSIVKALRDLGNDVTIYGIPGGTDLYNPFKWRGQYQQIPLNYVRFTVSFKQKYRLFYPLNLISYRKTLEHIKMQKPDLIHERFHLPNPYSIKIWEDTKIPKVLEVNSLYVEEGTYGKRERKIAIEEREKLFLQSEAIITQTETLKGMIEEITDKPVFVVPNGVDTEKFRPDLQFDDLKRGLELEDELVVAFVGSFRKWHGVHHISKIADRFQDDDVKFLLIGSGEMFEEVKKAKSDNMVLLGAKSHDDVPRYLALSDILIAPFDGRYFEGSNFWWNPVKLFEYMAAGKPIVSYDYGEIEKIVGGSALLARADDLEDFVSKLRYLIEDEGLRRELGKRGRKAAVERYDWSAQAGKILNIYDLVIP